MNKDDIIALKNELVATTEFQERNRQYECNWAAYRGKYEDIDPLAAVKSSPAGTDIRRKTYAMQVWNLQKPIVDTSVMFLSRMPQLTVPPVEMGVPEAGQKADKQERILYALWDKNVMVYKHALIAFHLSCFGTSVEFVRPDEKKKLPWLAVRHPSTCYPVVQGEGSREVGMTIFFWKEKVRTALRHFEGLRTIPSLKTSMGSSDQVDVIEFIDENEYVLIVGEQVARQKIHSFGYVPVRITPAIETGSLFGPCEIDQLIATNIYLNRTMTQMADAMEENLYPQTFFVGNDPVPINQGPGAYSWLPEGTQVQRLDPPRIPPEMFHQVAQVEDYVRTHANWPRAMSGDVQGGYATGKAIQKMQAPSASVAGIRQMNMAFDLSMCNEFMLRLLDEVWPNEEFTWNTMLSPGAGAPPKRMAAIQVNFVPSQDINGYYLNQVRYSIWGMDFNASVVSGLQLQGAGVFSKLTLLDNLPGVDNATSELAQVRQEKRDDMELEIELRRRLLEAETEAAVAQQQAAAGGAAAPGAEETASSPAPEPSPEEAAAQAAAGGQPMAQEVMPGGPVAMQGTSPSVMGMGEPLVGEENFPLPYQQVQPYGQALGVMGAETGGDGQPIEREPEAPEPGMVTAEEVAAALQQVEKLKGSVYLLGRIAQYGSTPKWIELGITDSLDKATIINSPAMQEFKGNLDITVLKKKIPDEAVLVIGEGNGEQAVS